MAGLREAGDDAPAPRALREKGAGALRVADGGRQADTPRVDACHAREPLEQAERLPAAVTAQQGVHLVDDHEAQVAEETRDRHVLVEQQRLERLGRDLEDARGLLEQLRLVRLRDVAVPMPDGDIGLGAQIVQADELVVDEGLQGTDIDGPDTCGRILVEQCQDGEERRLGLARGGRCREQHVVVGVEDSVRRGDLDGTQAFPIMRVDEVLDERGVAIESVHGPPVHDRYTRTCVLVYRYLGRYASASAYN